jgi:hypothetical protein
MSELAEERAGLRERRTRDRGRKTGPGPYLWTVRVASVSVRDAEAALLKARARRARTVRNALRAGWSVRGLAEALGVDPKWVQRAQRQD